MLPFNMETIIIKLSQCMRCPTMWYVRQAKPQISLRKRAVWSEPLLVAWAFYDCKATDWTPFWVSKLNRRLQMGSYFKLSRLDWALPGCRLQWQISPREVCIINMKWLSRCSCMLVLDWYKHNSQTIIIRATHWWLYISPVLINVLPSLRF